MNQWSAGLERQLWGGGGFEVQYLGSHSYHLDRSYWNNTPLSPGPGSVNSRRPNKLFGAIRTFNNDEIANYESMTAIFHQRMSHGLQMMASYTWSHTLDVSTDSNGGGAPMNPYWWKADYGNANWDIRHRFVATFDYDIPFFATSNPLLKGVFTKWQANGIITLQTGTPFNVSTGTDTANTGFAKRLRSSAFSATCLHRDAYWHSLQDLGEIPRALTKQVYDLRLAAETMWKENQSSVAHLQSQLNHFQKRLARAQPRRRLDACAHALEGPNIGIYEKARAVPRSILDELCFKDGSQDL